MFLFQLISFLAGYVVILVTGEAPEKFVNMAASRGIQLWEITRVREGAILLKVRLNAVRALRHIARRTRCRFRIRRRVGLPASRGHSRTGAETRRWKRHSWRRRSG